MELASDVCMIVSEFIRVDHVQTNLLREVACKERPKIPVIVPFLSMELAASRVNVVLFASFLIHESAVFLVVRACHLPWLEYLSMVAPMTVSYW